MVDKKSCIGYLDGEQCLLTIVVVCLYHNDHIEKFSFPLFEILLIWALFGSETIVLEGRPLDS